MMTPKKTLSTQYSTQKVHISTTAPEVPPDPDVAATSFMLPEFCYPLMGAVALIWAGRAIKTNYAEAKSMVLVFRESWARQKNIDQDV